MEDEQAGPSHGVSTHRKRWGAGYRVVLGDVVFLAIGLGGLATVMRSEDAANQLLGVLCIALSVLLGYVSLKKRKRLRLSEPHGPGPSHSGGARFETAVQQVTIHLLEGKSAQGCVRALKEAGWSEPEATRLVGDINADLCAPSIKKKIDGFRRRQYEQQRREGMAVGAAGVIVSVIASFLNPTFVVDLIALSAIVLGLVDIITATVNLRRLPRSPVAPPIR